jgi:DNA topoisomerase-1
MAVIASKRWMTTERVSKKRKKEPVEIVTDPVESAKAAGLRYVYDDQPGISRLRRGKGFRYLADDGAPVRDAKILARIKSLVIPPAWNQVWICSDANGHLQCTGRDAKGRKQSRYHPRWRAVRDETKYERMLLFGEVLPTIRKRVERDLAVRGLPREKVLAAIIRLLETTYIRVGNEEYAKTNGSYGLTTLRNRHVKVRGSRIHFSFAGKSGVEHAIDLNDKRLARIVKSCSDLPGYELFQYVGEDGLPHTVDAEDVNEYLREITAQHFTAKDFRTWAGTVLACAVLKEFDAFASATEAKRNVVQAIKKVAATLGNTPSVCRKAYIHPAVLECYTSGILTRAEKRCAEAQMAAAANPLRDEEAAMMRLLRERTSLLAKAS